MRCAVQQKLRGLQKRRVFIERVQHRWRACAAWHLHRELRILWSASFAKQVRVRLCVSTFLFLGVLGVVSSAAAEQSPPNSFAGQMISDGKTGRVGVGTTTPQATLDVYQGEIKIGSTGAACTASLAGTMRSTDNKLQFCDGTSWRNVSLDKAQ
jgi:hypothetical protein